MWFILALVTILFWSFGDIFCKSSSDEQDKLSHWKIVIAVGTVMGAHAVYLLLSGNTFHFADIITYLPVSFFYILSMILGYVGLRYLAVSILSPVSNSSGAVVCVLCLIIGQTMSGWDIAGAVLTSLGIILLSIIEQRADRKSLTEGDKKYTHGALALIFPILYCVFDALGTFGDAMVLDTYNLLEEEAVLISYELTFFAMAVFAVIYITLIKKQPLRLGKTTPKLAMAGVCETAGQISYTYAMATEDKAVVVAPMIACYCLFSMVWARIFLKEKLSAWHYVALGIAAVGILCFGLSEGFSE